MREENHNFDNNYLIQIKYISIRGCRGRDRMVVQIPLQSVPITNKVVSSNRAHGEVYSIQQYVIQFVSEKALKIPKG